MLQRGDNMDIGNYIKELRTSQGLSQEELGKILGVQRAAVYKWESGMVKNLKRETIKKLAEYFGVSPANFVKLDTPEVATVYVEFPVMGEVAAGFDKIALEDWEGEKIQVPLSYLKGKSKNDFFVLQVKGDSMYPLYMDGDKVLIQKQNAIDYSGQIAVAIYNDECGTIKKIEYKKDSISLIPINPQYLPTVLKDDNIEKVHILGIPKLLIRDLEEG